MPAALVPATRRTDLRRIGPFFALVVAAHGLMLAMPRQVGIASGTPEPAAQTVQVRFVEVPARAALAPAPTAAEADAAPTRTLEAPAPLPPVADPLPQASQTETAIAAAVPFVPPAPTWLGVALPGIATADDQYFARSLLSVAPAPLQPVLIAYPAFTGDAGRYVSELSLFIDETGTVVKVRVDGDPLPPPLEAAARSAFLSARFRPGEVAERGAVKSRIRIEVTFDSREAPRGG